MKNFTKQATALMLSGALVFGLVAATATDVNDPNLIKIEKTANLLHQLNPVTNSMKVILGVMLDKQQKLRLEIFDSNDELVHKFLYKNTEGFMQLFDMEALGDGEYLFRITTADATYIDNVIVGEQAPKEEPFQVYISEVEDQKIKFSYADAKGDVVLSVKDSKGKTIFSESLGSDYSSSGIANLSKLNKSKYTIKISNGLQSESKTIEIN